MPNKLIKASFFQKFPLVKDILSLSIFISIILVGTVLINAFVFRSYNVVGASMEDTLHEHDRVVVNRLPVTWAHLLGQEYVPNRGDIIVFNNGDGNSSLVNCAPPKDRKEQYIIKRVIAFEGERVVVDEGKLTVFNEENPDGFDIDHLYGNDEPKTYTSGDVDTIVPKGEIFVAGDNREQDHSYDSRNGLSTIPLCRIIGPASVRILPLNAIRFF